MNRDALKGSLLAMLIMVAAVTSAQAGLTIPVCPPPSIAGLLENVAFLQFSCEVVWDDPVPARTLPRQEKPAPDRARASVPVPVAQEAPDRSRDSLPIRQEKLSDGHIRN